MKIAILYICTGLYNQFFKGFYDSCEKYFLHGIADIEYFVFTDDMSLSDAENVHLTYKKCEGFPNDSLFRFEIFLQRETELEKFDYIFFFNSNSKFVRPVGLNILPTEAEGLVGVRGPGSFKYEKFPSMYAFERNPKSKAYIPPFEKNYKYYAGGINGGTGTAYMEMVKTLAKNIRDDYNNGIVAIYHDESHLNNYLHYHQHKELGTDYMWPETDVIPPSVKLIIIDKTKFNNYFKKGRKPGIRGRILKAYTKLSHAIKWYIK